MSWTKRITIWCEKVECSSYIVYSREHRHITIKDARIYAQENGWVHWNGRDICPKCKKTDWWTN